VPLRKLLDEVSGGGRSVKKQHTAGFLAGVLPSMRDVTRHECTGPRAAGRHLVADLEGEFAGNDPSNLIAVVVQMMEARSASWQGLLEHHDALAGLASEELQLEEATRCRRLDMFSTTRRYDNAPCCPHARFLLTFASAHTEGS
jgi:hypothetical protein